MPSDAEVDRALWSLRAYDTIALATASGSGPHVAAYFFAPERTGDGLQLLIAMPQDSRKLREIAEDPRVAFMCYPGSAARWITGWGNARVLEQRGALELSSRLLAHAPAARTFVEGSAVAAIEVRIMRAEIVDAVDTPPRIIEF